MLQLSQSLDVCDSVIVAAGLGERALACMKVKRRLVRMGPGMGEIEAKTVSQRAGISKFEAKTWLQANFVIVAKLGRL